MSRPAGFKIVHWTPDEVATLLRLKALEKTWREIGNAIGRSRQAAKNKWFESQEVCE